MNIRLATTKDLDGISKCHKASIRGLCKDAYPAECIEKWTRILIPEIYESAIREKILMVVEEENGISGFGILDIGNTELSALYVHPGMTGKGMAKTILARLEAIASEKSAHQLTLCSTVNALGFYQRHGYIEDGKTFHELPDGLHIECIKMHKVLRKIV